MSGCENHWNKAMQMHGFKNEPAKFGAFKGVSAGRRTWSFRRHVKNIGFVFLWMGFFIIFDEFMVSVFDAVNLRNVSRPTRSSWPKEDRNASGEVEKPAVKMYDRLLHMASTALTEKEFKQESSSFWEKPQRQASLWKPCADKKAPTGSGKLGNSRGDNGYILVSANGGLNQQRVAICNAVAVASLLNATLILPRFLYSNVWKDPSQFGHIYQEKYFIKTLEGDVNIVKELPPHLRSLDFEAIGSQITDADIAKEAKPVDYISGVLPILKRNGIVHFLGFGNRLGFDPVPFNLQRLRCKCNFHALKFIPKIQRAGSLLVKRIRKYDASQNILDKQLLGNFLPAPPLGRHDIAKGRSKYLALHLRFEEDMVAYSRCEFGGGKDERKELQAYREVHFPLLMERLKKTKYVSPAELRKLGRCPLTPEEAALVLAGLGFKRDTFIYLAGSDIYGGMSRMRPLTGLYPNLVTKETLLTPSELSPFRNFSSQLAALDFIVCATADVFAMTDSGSQLSSLVSGFRTYYGGEHAPTLRPGKKRLAAILSRNTTIRWKTFEYKVKKLIEEGQIVQMRRFGRSIYRQPRCPECMCRSPSLSQFMPARNSY